MKPFNLELALAGYAVVTRGGQIVTGLYEVKCRETANWLSGQRCGFICTWNINGSMQQGVENKNDLFMKTERKLIEGWVNVFTRYLQLGKHSGFCMSFSSLLCCLNIMASRA